MRAPRAARASAPSASRVVDVRAGRFDLPSFDPGATPRGGWTYDAAVRVCLAYGETHGLLTPGGTASAAHSAFRALSTSVLLNGTAAPGVGGAFGSGDLFMEHLRRTLSDEPDPFARDENARVPAEPLPPF